MTQQIRFFGLNRAGVTFHNVSLPAGGSALIDLNAQIGALAGDRIRLASIRGLAYQWGSIPASANDGELFPPNAVEFLDVPPNQTSIGLFNRDAANSSDVSISVVARATDLYT